MPRVGIVVYRDEDGLNSARKRYEIAKSASVGIKTEAIEDYLFKKAMKYFYPDWSGNDDGLPTLEAEEPDLNAALHTLYRETINEGK